MQRREPKQARPDLGKLVAQLLFSVQEELFARLHDRGHPQVRPRHGAVLAYLDLEGKGTRATELAQRSGQHKQVVGTTVDELVKLGYVRREPDPADRRAKLIVLTDLGVDEVTKARAILSAIEQRHEQALGAERYTQFKGTFQQITRSQRAWREQSPPAKP